MSQTFSALQSGVTTFNQLYGILNNNIDAIRSQWSGSAAPSSPVIGQPFYNTGNGAITIWTGTAWVDIASASTSVLAATAEIISARGSAASLDARLSVALNPDGTLKSAAPVGDWWMSEADTVLYVDASTFTVSGDKTAIYLANRAIYFDQTTDDYGYVVSSSYNSGTGVTTVVINDATVDSGLVGVEYGQPPANAPKLADSLLVTNNLSDLSNAPAARINLGLEIGVDVLAPDGDGSGLIGLQLSQISDAGTAAAATIGTGDDEVPTNSLIQSGVPVGVTAYFNGLYSDIPAGWNMETTIDQLQGPRGNFAAVSTGTFDVRNIEVMPGGAAIWLADNTNKKVWRSLDGGVTFVDLNASVLDFTDLAFNPVTQELWAAVSGDGIYKSTDYGSTWTEIVDSTIGFQSVAVNYNTGKVYCCYSAGGSGGVYRLDGDALVSIFSSGGFQALAVNSVTGDIWAAVYSGAVYKCPGGSTTFTEVAGSSSKTWLACAVSPFTGEVWFNTGASGFYMTDDGGETIVRNDLGLTAVSGWRGFGIDIYNGSAFTVSTNAADKHVYRSNVNNFIPIKKA